MAPTTITLTFCIPASLRCLALIAAKRAALAAIKDNKETA